MKKNMYRKNTKHFGDLSQIDVMYSRPEDDCSVLVLVAVGYVNGNPENQTDLLDKLEGYLNHINSDDFKVDYPQSTVYIDVTFQEMPHVHITDLLFKCIPLCKENGAVLRVKIGEDYYSFI